MEIGNLSMPNAIANATVAQFENVRHKPGLEPQNQKFSIPYVDLLFVRFQEYLY
jgi:hypothetical protein